ncbi:MAG: hypothetical protein U1E52_17950 [Geminicoccaceae bacterium]
MSEAAVLRAARRAFRSVPLYRNLYGELPRVADDVPFVDRRTYADCRRLSDCIDGALPPCNAVPSFHRRRPHFPTTIVECPADRQARTDRLRRALSRLGIGARRFLADVVILASDETGPFACDIADLLALCGGQVAVGFPACAHDAAALTGQATLVLVLQSPDTTIPPPTLAAAVVVCHAAEASRWGAAAHRILMCEGPHALAVAPRGATTFVAVDGDWLVEPTFSGTALTNTRRSCFPLVRYVVDIDVAIQP